MEIIYGHANKKKLHMIANSHASYMMDGIHYKDGQHVLFPTFLNFQVLIVERAKIQAPQS